MHTHTIRILAAVIGAACSSLATARAEWVQSLRTADVAYFLFEYSPRLERYALTNGQWLAPLDLPVIYGLPSTFHVDNDNIYVGFGKTLRRFDLDGSNDVHLINTIDPVQGIFSDGNILVVNHTSYLYARLTSLDKTTGTIIDQFENYVDSIFGASIAPSINKIFGRSGGVSPSDITYASYDDDGMFVGGGDSPHHGDYPGGDRTWVFPGDAKVVDSSGTVYSTDGLAYLNSFGGIVDDLAFYGADIPIVLREGELIAYSNALLPTGSRMLAFMPENIYVSGTNVLAFTPDAGQANGIRVDAVPLSTLNPPVPGQPVDPKGLPYTPDDAFVDQDGILYLFSKAHQSLFRWDTVNQSYLASLPLVGVPNYVAYSSNNHRVYLAYNSGLIREMDLNASSPVETPFANLATAPIGLSTAGAYVFAMDHSGAWGTHYTFDPAGGKVDSVDWNYYSREFIWSPVNQKMYFFRDDTSPNDLLWEQINANGTAYPGEPPGGIGTYFDSPLHESFGFVHPIRVAPDGSIVVLGSGVIHNAQTLARLPVGLGNAIADAAWLNGQLRTVRTINELSQFQQWLAPNFGLGTVRQVPGVAHRLFTLKSSQLLGISIQAGKPSFYVLGGSFNVVAPPVLEPPTGLMTGIASTSQINLSWDDASGEESYAIERRIGLGGSWVEIGTTPTSTTTFTDGSVAAGNAYYYRVISRNGLVNSSPSAEVPAVLMVPNTPTNLVASAQSFSAIAVTWDDVLFETSYQLEYRVGASGSWTSLAQLGAGTTSYTHAGLSPNTDYRFRLRAVNGLGASPYSIEAGAVTDAIAPTAPYLYDAIAQGPFLVNLYWSDSDYEDHYYVERRTGGFGSWTLIGIVGRNVTSYYDYTTAASTTYQYRIHATNTAGASDYSETRTVTTPEIPPPSAPWYLEANADSLSSILVVWDDVLVETGYSLERRTDDPDSWIVIAILDANTTSHLDTNVVAATQYFYRIQAFNDQGISPYSNEDDAIPANIVNLIADDFDPGISTGDWSSISGGVATNGGQGFRGSQALWFGAAGGRSATTLAVDVSSGGTIEFLFRAGNEELDGELWDNSEDGDYVVLEYSTDAGGEWNEFEFLYTVYPSLSEWTTYSVGIPEEAFGRHTQFRWRQLANSGSGYDTWALEDVRVRGVAPAPPGPPPFILSGANSSTAIAIFWIAADGATSYVIERRQGVQPWSVLATVSGNTTYYTDTTALPQTAYVYRVKAINAGGQSPYSATTLAVTWSQMQDWLYSNYGSIDAMSEEDMQTPGPDGLVPLLRYAFDLSADEPARHVVPGQSESGFPAIWLDKTRDRLCVEFVRRKDGSHPGVSYQVEFSSSFGIWTPATSPASISAIDGVWERVRYEDALPAAQTQSRFGRVTVQPR